ncbi:MAG: hypothetical protein DHS20C01_11600 [marine bacterium B5-7]|nr:MAG: hypothetical protein DHS20C01_11600 [marine bacterium B5-7]
MLIDLNKLTPQQVYFTLIQTVIPRPIAWVLSENEGGSYNLAPFSYFNAVCSDPPLVMISIGRKPDGAFKDTKINIEERPDFVIHIVDEDTLDDMNASSATLPYGASELAEVGLETTAIDDFPLPRLKRVKVAFACTRHQVLQLGGSPQSIVFGEVKKVFVEDSVVGEDAKGRAKILADKIRPVGRMGASEYLSFGEIIRKARPA